MPSAAVSVDWQAHTLVCATCSSSLVSNGSTALPAPCQGDEIQWAEWQSESIRSLCLCWNSDGSALLPPGPYFTLPISNKKNMDFSDVGHFFHLRFLELVVLWNQYNLNTPSTILKSPGIFPHHRERETQQITHNISAVQSESAIVSHFENIHPYTWVCLLFGHAEFVLADITCMLHLEEVKSSVIFGDHCRKSLQLKSYPALVLDWTYEKELAFISVISDNLQPVPLKCPTLVYFTWQTNIFTMTLVQMWFTEREKCLQICGRYELVTIYLYNT